MTASRCCGAGGWSRSGAPTSCYGAPVNLFVGGFVGRSSSFEVDILSVSAQGVRVVVDGVAWTVDAAPGRPLPRPGPAVMLVRPESLRLYPPGARAWSRRRSRVAGSLAPERSSRCGPKAGRPWRSWRRLPPRDSASGSACCRVGGRVVESTSSRSISRDQPKAFPARRLRALSRRAGLAGGLSDRAGAARGIAGTPGGWTLHSCGSSWSDPPNGARSGEPLDLARERGARRSASGCRSPFSSPGTNSPAYELLGSVVALPAVLPPLVGVLAFLFLYGETGFVSLLVQRMLGLDDAALAAPGCRRGAAGARLLDVRLLLPLHPRRARLARRVPARGGRVARAPGPGVPSAAW